MAAEPYGDGQGRIAVGVGVMRISAPVQQELDGPGAITDDGAVQGGAAVDIEQIDEIGARQEPAHDRDIAAKGGPVQRPAPAEVDLLGRAVIGVLTGGVEICNVLEIPSNNGL